MIATLSKQAGRRYPQMRTLSVSSPQWLPSVGPSRVHGDFLHGRLTIRPMLRGQIVVKLAVGGKLGINP